MLNEILNWLYIIANGFAAYPFSLLLQSFLPARSPVLWKLPIFAGSYFAVTTIIYTADPVNIYGLCLLLIAIMVICFRGPLIQKLSAVIVLHPLVTAINFFSMDLGRLSYTLMPQSPTIENLSILTTVFFRLIIWIAIYRIFQKWIAQAAKTMTVKMWIITDLVCLAAFVQITSVMILAPEYPTYPVYPSCIAAIITSLGSIYLIAYIAKTIQSDMEIKTLKYQQSYYLELEHNQQQVRKIRHDMNNHLCVIGSLMEKGDNTGAKDYFQNLAGEFTISNRIFCENSVVNAVINAKYNEATEKEIDCFFSIDLKGFTAIDQISLCSIFANTLDNAIEAAAKIKEPSKRKLSLKCRYKDGYFIYELVNSKVNPIRQSRGAYLTDKPDTTAHGIGLKTVKEITNRYRGTIDISHTENSFSVIILIETLNL